MFFFLLNQERVGGTGDVENVSMYYVLYLSLTKENRILHYVKKTVSELTIVWLLLLWEIKPTHFKNPLNSRKNKKIHPWFKMINALRMNFFFHNTRVTSLILVIY